MTIELLNLTGYAQQAAYLREQFPKIKALMLEHGSLIDYREVFRRRLGVSSGGPGWRTDCKHELPSTPRFGCYTIVFPKLDETGWEFETRYRENSEFWLPGEILYSESKGLKSEISDFNAHTWLQFFDEGYFYQFNVLSGDKSHELPPELITKITELNRSSISLENLAAK